MTAAAVIPRPHGGHTVALELIASALTGSAAVGSISRPRPALHCIAMRAILQQAHEARIARLQSRWSRITVTWTTHAQPSHDHAATIAPAGAAVIPSAVAAVFPCSVSLLTEERVGETVGSIVWEGCAALMVHLMAPSAAASAARSGDAAARSPLPLSDRLRGVRAIELGAGVGVLGCLAAKLGAQVCITDRREIMHVIQHNIEANQLQHQAQVPCTPAAGEGSATAKAWNHRGLAGRMICSSVLCACVYCADFHAPSQCVELEWGTKPEVRWITLVDDSCAAYARMRLYPRVALIVITASVALSVLRQAMSGAPFDLIIASDVIYKSDATSDRTPPNDCRVRGLAWRWLICVCLLVLFLFAFLVAVYRPHGSYSRHWSS